MQAATVDAAGKGMIKHISLYCVSTFYFQNIVSLAITPSKIFALSASGKIYVMSSSLSRQLATQSPRSVWNIFGSSAPQTLFGILDTDVPLGWGER